MRISTPNICQSFFISILRIFNMIINCSSFRIEQIKILVFISRNCLIPTMLICFYYNLPSVTFHSIFSISYSSFSVCPIIRNKQVQVKNPITNVLISFILFSLYIWLWCSLTPSNQQCYQQEFLHLLTNTTTSTSNKIHYNC